MPPKQTVYFWREGRAGILCLHVSHRVMPYTYLVFNKYSRKKMLLFRRYSVGLDGIVLCAKFRNKKPNSSKIASFCILHFDDVSKVWFPRFFMPLIQSKLPYISVVSRQEVTRKGTEPPVT